MDVRQSPFYARYIERIGWKVEKVGRWHAYIRRFPLFGSFIKIQRITPPIPFSSINRLIKKYRAFRVVIELGNEASKGRTPPATLRVRPYLIGNTPYAPSKTIHIDLTAAENKIFQRFAEAKRRAVRRAIKNRIIVEESDDIEEFIRLKMKQDFLFGYLLRKDLRALWETFTKKHSCLLLAFHNEASYSNPIAGVVLLFWDKVAYYWQAAATKEGKKLFAPTLLVWEALKLSKKRGCRIFDFEGVYDERFPEATKNWHGFTKFKEGFGGNTVSLPPPLIR